ncbi:hypothetical protein A1Q1_00461 [Trichosporon asahii var. asahii CBS 2479]|uniref:Uncharacterized protein n=1 Tax=Trichosporon asahii var. asahii (strain ATCC 90039 / CBS 2479 / JCM 2466 / KCTC 7840 / NBRC 103889/ NCYC 2677 / UAMH 7654) TaxID=1186058 RepID=J6F4R6_TRIAS|nr:hypothetical protein A1Q1_00461 [Trichosporon asahii var. asahii CBS 2479]EJT50267.1 hypothetical protein A1Q1_00461 [Trichosporon asahii var. asahii CBS 2479]
MLANYLPDENVSITFREKLANVRTRATPTSWRGYQHIPAVDEALKRADQKAQAEALGNALRRGKESQQRRSVAPSQAEKIVAQARKTMFWTGAVAFYATHGLHLVNQSLIGSLTVGQALVGFQMAACFALATWDPLWFNSWRGMQPPPREKRLAIDLSRIFQTIGRLYGALWLLVWTQSEHPPDWLISPAWSAVVDVLALSVFVWVTYQCMHQRPVTLRLVRPVSAPTTPSSADADAHADSLSALSLSGTSQVNGRPPPPPQPIFGKQSLGLTPPPRDESEPMDWEPTAADSSNETGSDWDRFGIGRQNMFPRASASEETGLEPLLATWGLGPDPSSNTMPGSRVNGIVDVQMMPAESSLTWVRARLAAAQRALAVVRAGSALLSPTPAVRVAYLVVESLISATRALFSDERWTAIVNGADAVLRISSVLAISRGVRVPLAVEPSMLAAVEGVAWSLLTLVVSTMTSERE